MTRPLTFLAIAFVCMACFAQTLTDREEFEFNRRLAQSSHFVTPKNGLVPDEQTASAVAYAVAIPIYGRKKMDEEMPFRAELKNGIWTVLGTLHCKSCVGGTLVVQINKADGKIVFLTHTQ